YRSRRRFLFQSKRHLSFTPSLLLSKSQPLRWVVIWFGCKLESDGIYSVGIIHVAASVILLAASFFKACRKGVFNKQSSSQLPLRGTLLY
ncbi:MAG: hypothetical protein PUJ93_03425, partial [Oscillospiraceae bacterium]|nr:hypothetical protein [Oscillospiraceae bacterium]MDY5735488.1 hypothetical protein [Oscillospiraceae bacterium]